MLRKQRDNFETVITQSPLETQRTSRKQMSLCDIQDIF